MDDDRIGVGVIGCGGFGLFALQHFTQVPVNSYVGIKELDKEFTKLERKTALLSGAH